MNNQSPTTNQATASSDSWQGSTITLLGQLFVPINEFADYKHLDLDKAINMVKEGFYSGRMHDGEWYVALDEIIHGAKPQVQREIAEDDAEYSSSFDKFISGGYGLNHTMLILIPLHFMIGATIFMTASEVGRIFLIPAHMIFFGMGFIAIWRSASLYSTNQVWPIIAKVIVLYLLFEAIVFWHHATPF